MKRPPLLAAALILAGAAGAVLADDGARRVIPLEEAVPDAEWVSYREAYKQMIRFEKYGKPKNLIQSHYQAVPRDRSISLDGVRLAVSGASTHLELALDPAGRATFPLLKSAYDDNARVLLNRKAGLFALQPRISIALRADGIYDTTELQAACEQALDYLRYIGKPGSQEMRCVGVRFSYARNAAGISIRFRSAERSTVPITLEEASAFPDDAAPVMKTATYRFADWPEKGQVVTQSAPAAIAPVFGAR